MTNESPDLIDQQRVQELVRRLPDPMARHALISVCIPLADRLAQRFRHSGEPIDDLIQAARFGLIKAVDNADSGKADAFLGYATLVIRGEVRHHLRDAAQLVKRPRAIHDNEWAVRAAGESLTQQLGRAPTIREIAETAQLPQAVVVDVYTAMMGGPLSAHALEDSGVIQADKGQEISLVVEWQSVAPALASLPTLERHALFLRFYRELTQSEVAAELGVSQVQVSRLLRRALDQLRASVG